ncbi:hypothetical protein [Thalassoporum mexicanum]|uniref:hypothetical protein n=1 Tax=Thalassoporum mexicanum TaxID=3457544 RepID=UPI0012EA339E|nr:hypothetical protein [Pseudanabaena sp. PCC 7367]
MARHNRRNRAFRRFNPKHLLHLAIVLLVVFTCLPPVASLAINPSPSVHQSQQNASPLQISDQAARSPVLEHSHPETLAKLPRLPRLKLPPGIVEDTTANAWGQAGVIAYKAGANTMQARNGQGKSLDIGQKQALRPHFGKLVDRVRVSYGAQMLDRWEVDGKPLLLSSVESSAQAFCDRIYVKAPYAKNAPNQLILLAHELVHSKQCQDLGGIEGFGYAYFKAYKLANQVYRDNKLEVEAFKFQNQFANQLGYRLVIP